MHDISACPNPCTHPYTLATYHALRKNKIESFEEIEQAEPFREEHLDALTELWDQSPSFTLTRNLLLLTLGYETMLRSAELARIRLSDIDFKNDGTAILKIPFTKTNKSGKPEFCSLSDITVELTRYYLGFFKSFKRQWHLIRGSSKHDTPLIPKGNVDSKPISNQSVRNIYRSAHQALGRDTLHLKRFTGHSTRVGAAQDLMSKNYEMPAIMQSGRWRTSTMPVHYGKGIMAEESAMARMRRKKK